MYVCVFCASSQKIDPKYFQLAADAGAELARRGHHLVSGGAIVSCMGEVARAARAGGAQTIGVIPQVLVDIEIADTESTELIVTTGMRERKSVMDARSDAFLVLPGGIGTMEELFEIWTARVLGIHRRPAGPARPVGPLRPPLKDLVNGMYDQGFTRPDVFDGISWATSVEEAFDLLEQPVPRITPGPTRLRRALAGPGPVACARRSPRSWRPPGRSPSAWAGSVTRNAARPRQVSTAATAMASSRSAGRSTTGSWAAARRWSMLSRSPHVARFVCAGRTRSRRARGRGLRGLGVHGPGRGDGGVPPDVPPLELPEAAQVTAVDLVTVQFPVGLVGYHTGSVDETLQRAATAIRDRDARIAVLEQKVAELMAGRLQARHEIFAPPAEQVEAEESW